MPNRFQVAVLVSGSGSNLQAIIDASADPSYAAEVCVVIADRPGIRALQRAGDAGIPTAVVPWSLGREPATARVCATADRFGANALVLAGFSRILAPEAIARFPTRIVNVHPSLLPAFPATIHAVREAIEHGVKVTGVTVHFVTEDVDAGPIIAQEAVCVAPGDTVATLHARMQEVEHRLYPAVVHALGRGRLRTEGRTVVWREEA